MRGLLAICVAGVAAVSVCRGQNIILTNGSVVATKGVRRAGDTIMATVELQQVQPGAPTTGEFGYPLAQISRIDFPRPYQLDVAADAINAGKIGDAQQQLQAVLGYYEGFRDTPGSWWADATLLKVAALISAGQRDEGTQLAQAMGRVAVNPDVIAAARVYGAAALARQGQEVQAEQVFEEVERDSSWPEALALAALYKGELHLAHEAWEQALLSILKVPVFYPEQKVLMPAVLLESARAYLGLRDIARAKTALEELTTKYPATPEAGLAKAETERVAKLEKSLSPQK